MNNIPGLVLSYVPPAPASAPPTPFSSRPSSASSQATVTPPGDPSQHPFLALWKHPGERSVVGLLITNGNSAFGVAGSPQLRRYYVPVGSTPNHGDSPATPLVFTDARLHGYVNISQILTVDSARLHPYHRNNIRLASLLSDEGCNQLLKARALPVSLLVNQAWRSVYESMLASLTPDDGSGDGSGTATTNPPLPQQQQQQQQPEPSNTALVNANALPFTPGTNELWAMICSKPSVNHFDIPDDTTDVKTWIVADHAVTG